MPAAHGLISCSGATSMSPDIFLASDEFSALVKQYARDASVAGRLAAFGVSEALPSNWRESVPVVINALKEYATELS